MSILDNEGHDPQGLGNQRRLICEGCRRLAEVAEENDRLRAALDRSRIALDDWLNTYAPDLCDEERVAEAERRIGSVGTLFYIASVQEQNRAALGDQQTPEGK